MRNHFDKLYVFAQSLTRPPRRVKGFSLLGLLCSALFITPSLAANTFGTKENKGEETALVSKEGAVHDGKENLDPVIISNQTVFEDKELNKLAGSYLYLNSKTLAKFDYTDVNRLFRGRAGVHLYEETGWGFLPNISIRGTSPARSAGINLMEDGILAAPSPYSGPAAYYFPSIGRMQGVEILKGSGQVVNGPNTVGGSINLISSQVPKKLEGSVNLAYGSFNTFQLHAKVGDKIHKHFGYLVEYYRQSSDGYLHTRDGQRAGGFALQDFVGKILIDYTNGPINLGKLQFKIQASNYNNNFSYLGLAVQDYQKDPYLMYSAAVGTGFQKGRHQTVVASYEISPIKDLTINIDGYYSLYHRDFLNFGDVRYKGIKSGGRTFAPSNSTRAVNDTFVQIVRGDYNRAANDTLTLLNNDRLHEAWGVQLNGRYNLDKIHSVVRFGVRWHQDDVDRFQSETYWRQRGSARTQLGNRKIQSGGDRYAKATAIAAYVQYQYTFQEKLTITAGLRYENVSMFENRYKAGSNKSRKRTAQPTSTRKNDNVSSFIPGISIAYLPTENFTVFAGVHRGFSPAGAASGVKPQFSINYEFGLRYHNDYVHLEGTGYANQYTNLLGVPFAALGAGTDVLSVQNEGRAIAAGFEGSARVTLLAKNEYIHIPISADYTFFYGKYITGFRQGGSVNARTRMPQGGTVIQPGTFMSLIPAHQARANVEIELFKRMIAFGISGRYFSAVSIEPTLVPHRKLRAQGVNIVSSNIVFDAFAHVYPTKNLKVYLVIENLFNNKYLAGMLPLGLRAGMPFFFKIGATVRL